MATKKVAPKKEEPKVLTADEVVAEVRRLRLSASPQGDAHFQNAEDALVQAIEMEKRVDLLYGRGRVTEGEGANETLVRDDKNRVE